VAREEQVMSYKSRRTGDLKQAEPSQRRGSINPVCMTLLGTWAVKAVRVGRSVGRYADYWTVPRGQAGGLLYVALGDSAAQGVGASRAERGYVGLLAQRMREQSGRPVQVVNLSHSGAKLADLVRDQLPRLAELSPDVVTVDIGGNDVVVYNAERFSALVCQFTAGLPAGAFVADVPYFMHGHWERRAAQTGRLLASCAEQNGLRVVRLHDAQQARGWAAMLTDFAADWFHPNDRGHRVWADAFWDRIACDPALTTAPPLLPSRPSLPGHPRIHLPRPAHRAVGHGDDQSRAASC
jgi:acyl-CoA thioesterase-1